MLKLYTTEQAGELLGMAKNEVLRHIHAGLLEGKLRQTARRTRRADGTLCKLKPRYMITSEAIEKYIKSLPDANPESLRALQKEPEKPRRKPRNLTGIAKEIAECVQYV